ncbi:uncharacterized protein LOC129313448 isoform X2 [Prosopis cineraria]|uniref:uncharacterized protein LOC129313448 isoform X2 n=1 Tax=Prosopis cineraria TaxID=364024 RepID=UPI00240F6E21|nr:uncharacterized protein LOC129313448 isoform X2 [Prosopis cineraria]XP_054812535.1 uncharacterized protein LOC129313448 isoform X2 [Prosopis cineraria]
MKMSILYARRGQITDMIHSSTWDVHPAAGNTSATLVNGILYHYNNPNVEISDKESFSEKGLVKCYNHIPACMEHQSASGLCIGRTMALVDCLLWQRHTITEILAKGGCALLEWKLETGRTHQIHAHSKYLGIPLLGDEVYGGRGSTAPSLLQPRTPTNLSGKIVQMVSWQNCTKL